MEISLTHTHTLPVGTRTHSVEDVFSFCKHYISRFEHILSFFPAALLKFSQIGWGASVSGHLHLPLQMFYGVQVWALAEPVCAIQWRILKPLQNCLGCMVLYPRLDLREDSLRRVPRTRWIGFRSDVHSGPFGDPYMHTSVCLFVNLLRPISSFVFITWGVDVRHTFTLLYRWVDRKENFLQFPYTEEN